MKTTACILTVLFAVNVHFMDAAISNPITKSPVIKSDFSNTWSNIAPTTPREADFSDSDPVPERTFDVLRPMTPKEASFDEQFSFAKNNSLDSLLRRLSPATPTSADFNEPVDRDFPEMLKPVAPRHADFTEFQ